mmetsp:Transcript_120729/g.180322  ORF Transcript_120729/g.180322 Transcript_120729/m.180322 type:complete len:283 (-) Transcript_120729:143-991(-)
MTLDTMLLLEGEDQRAKLSSWVKIKVNQSRPPVSKAMRTFLKQLSNDVDPEDIPEGRLLSALERETLIRAQKLQVVSDFEPASLHQSSPASACSLLAEWTQQERIPAHELAVRRNGVVVAQAEKKVVEEDALACHLGFCMDMNGKDFPPMSGLWDDEKWVDVDREEEEEEEDLKVSFMDDDDDWVLAVMLELEKSTPPTEEEENSKLDFRRAVLEGSSMRPLSGDSGVTEDTEVADEEEEAALGEGLGGDPDSDGDEAGAPGAGGPAKKKLGKGSSERNSPY